MEITSLLREITCHMGSHSVTCHPAVVTFPPLPQPKLVLSLATPVGRKAELTRLMPHQDMLVLLYIQINGLLCICCRFMMMCAFTSPTGLPLCRHISECVYLLQKLNDRNVTGECSHGSVVLAVYSYTSLSNSRQLIQGYNSSMWATRRVINH